MTEIEIRDTIFSILRQLAPETEPAKISPTDNLREALDIDSYDFLNLLIALHRRLNIEIPESDYTQLTTLSGLVRYIATHQPAPPAA